MSKFLQSTAIAFLFIGAVFLVGHFVPGTIVYILGACLGFTAARVGRALS